MAERELAILVKARDLASKTLKGVGREVDTLGKKTSKGLSTAAGNIGKLSIAAAGLATVLTVGSIKAAGDFEAQLNTINTVAQATPPALEKIGDGIRQIARDTGTPLEELTQGFYDLVSAGVDSSQAMKVLASSNRLAIGGLASAAEGVDLITTALNSYGVALKDQGAESERFADIFAKAIERGKVTAAELAQSFANIGPLAAANSIEIEELAAAYAQLTAKGVPAAEASTQMSAAIIALTRRTGDLEKLEKQTGKSYLAIAGSKGLVVALEELRKDAAKAKVPLIDLLGRQEALGFAINTTGDAMAGYTENLAAMNDANGTAARQMSERQQGLNFQIARLKALALDAGITIGSKLIPKLLPIGEKLVGMIAANQDDIEKFGDNLAAAFDRAIEFGERIPWATIGSGLQTAAQWAERLFDAFLGLPPEVQTTIIALAGLNKLSGGAITGIAGELGKGLIKGVLGMTAGVVHLKAGSVVGGGGVGAAGRAGVAGQASGGFAAAISKVFIVGAAAAFFGELLKVRLDQAGANQAQAAGTLQQATVYVAGANIDDLRNNLKGLRERQAFLTNNLTPEAIAYQLDIDGVKSTTERVISQLEAQITKLEGQSAARQNVTNERLEAIRGYSRADLTAAQRNVAATERQESIARTEGARTRQQLASGATRSELAITRMSGNVAGAVIRDGTSERAAIARAGQEAKSGGLSAADAIRRKRLSFSAYINNNVSIRDLGKQFTYKTKAGLTAL